MSTFDMVLLCIIGAFTLFGLWFGLFHTLGSLIGTLLGVYFASRWYPPFASWLMNLTGWTGNFAKVLTFILLFILINRLIGFGFYILDKMFSVVTHLPFVHSLDRLLGMIFGLVEGLVVLGIVFYFINKFPLGATFMSALGNSKVAPYCIQTSSVLWPLIPQAVQMLQNTLKNMFP